MNKIAVLITCFNRRKITKRCLESLQAINVNVDVFIVDDGSTDRTSEMISSKFTKINLIKGEGNLFWNRGMHKAWSEAIKNEYDYYLWLNDDVILYNNSFEEIIDCSNLKKDDVIISGVIESHSKDRVIYGGYDEKKNIIVPKGEMKEIKYLNGNFVLIPRQVFDKIGNLDPIFHHDLGDVDYGLRAQKEGVMVYSTRKPIGSGETNSISRLRLNNSTLIKRFERLNSPLGSNLRLNFYFRKKHFGFLHALSFVLFLVGLNIIPDWLNAFLFKNKYK